MTIQITIGAEIQLRGLTRDLRLHFRSKNTFDNPAWHKQRAMGLWTGNTPSQLKLWEERDGALALPRGYLREVLDKLRDRRHEVELIDATVLPFVEYPSTSGVLWPQQEQAIARMLARRSGVLEAPTGSGKTNVLLSMLPRLQTRALILVHTKELLKQTADRARSWLGVEPGVIGAGKWSIGREVTVGIIQTLAIRDLSQVAHLFGVVMVDEVHHCPSATWTKVVSQLPARYKYGFTATPERKDGLTFLLWRVIGEKLWTIPRKELQQAGRIVAPRRTVVKTGYTYRLRSKLDWGEMISDMVRDERRNRVIVSQVEKLRDQSVLVLSERIEHAETLAELLVARQPILLHGGLKKAERVSRMAEVRAGARLTIATSNLMGEGVDVPGWEALVMATPFSWKGSRRQQAIGRVTRAVAGKSEALVVELKDDIIFPDRGDER